MGLSEIVTSKPILRGGHLRSRSAATVWPLKMGRPKQGNLGGWGNCRVPRP